MPRSKNTIQRHPRVKFPSRLVDRLDDWHSNPPQLQHRAYGPIAAYLAALFPSTNFLVKPQSLLRGEEAEIDDDGGSDLEGSVDSRGTRPWI